MNIRALMSAAAAHLLILIGYSLLTPLLDVMAASNSEKHIYLQQELWVFADLLASLLPSYVLARMSLANPWLAAVVLRAIAFIPAMLLFSSHYWMFLSSRPVSFHLAFAILSGLSANYFWGKRGA